MNLSTLAQIGEFVGGIAVLLTIFYLAVQVRLSTRAMRGATQDATQLGTIDMLKHISATKESAILFAQGVVDLEGLEPAERIQFELMIHAIFLSFETSFNQWQRGDLHEDHWRSVADRMSWYLAQEGVKRWWLERVTFFAAPFEAFVEASNHIEGDRNTSWIRAYNSPRMED